MLDEAVDPLGEHALEVALTGATAGVGGHHPRDRGVCSEKGTELGSSFELGRQHGLEHGQQKVLFSGFVLVSVEGEHNGLEERVDLGQRDKTT